jgi:hypothetical protein
LKAGKKKFVDILKRHESAGIRLGMLNVSN